MRRSSSSLLTAWCYDVLSLEWPVYRAGRVAAIESLAPAPGSRVLDLGCGTGLNLPLLQRTVGRAGSVMALDVDAHMLRQVRRRVRRHGWRNVEVVQGDMTDPEALETLEAFTRLSAPAAGGFDAVIATYTLSLLTDWERGWATALQATRPGGRLAVVDMQLPVGAARRLSPLARAACALGGANITAHPWRGVERDCVNVEARSIRGGHIQVRVGTRP